MLRIKVTSDIGQAIDQLSRMPSDLSRGIITAVRTEAIRLQRHIVADYLHTSGMQSAVASFVGARGMPGLRSRSGRLARSIRSNINEEFVTEGGRVVGMSTTVGTNVEYAAYHEFGFHGTEQVSAHVRRIKSRSTFSRVERVSKKTGKTYNAKVQASQGIAFVRAHSRQVNYAGHPFMRPALADLQPTMRENIAAVVRAALEEGK